MLKIVRYLGQQGYGTDKLVILTPYLGQLRALQEALKKDNDPVLNDLDSFDLVRAGMLSPSAAKLNKKPIRLATIGMVSVIFARFLPTQHTQTTTREKKAISSSFRSRGATRITISGSCPLLSV